MSRLDVELEPKAAAGRRVEIIRGGGGRRRWSQDEKAQAVEASLNPGAVVSEVARRYGLTPQQLFGWRREARRKSESMADAAAFIPAVVDAGEVAASPPGRKDEAAPTLQPHVIELELDGVSVWIWRGADAAMVTAIIGALKASK